VFVAKIRITLRPSILDPQGKAVEHALASLGMTGVSGVRMGKYVELHVDAESEEKARRVTEDVCRKLLANPVMEDFTFEMTRR